MTVKELMEKLLMVPQDAIVMYQHNKYGRIDIDSIDYQQEMLMSGKIILTLTLKGEFKED